MVRNVIALAVVLGGLASAAGAAGEEILARCDPARGCPNLTVDERRLDVPILQARTFDFAGCAVQEGLVNGTGKRTLLRFDVVTSNIGPEDLELGDPARSPLFRFSPCHQHYHFDGYADYRLWTPAGYQAWLAIRGPSPPVSSRALLEANRQLASEVLVSRKQAFCLEDSVAYPSPGTGVKPPEFTCTFQGISAGWAAFYGQHLEGQWLDVTDVRPGEYVLEVEVNPERLLPESEFRDNAAAFRVVIDEQLGSAKPPR